VNSLPAADRQICLPVAVQSLDGAVTNKFNTDPKTAVTLTLILTLFPNSNPKIIKLVTEAVHFQTPTKMASNSNGIFVYRATWHHFLPGQLNATRQHCLFLHITWRALNQSWSRNSDLDITIWIFLLKCSQCVYDTTNLSDLCFLLFPDSFVIWCFAGLSFCRILLQNI